MSYFKAFDDKVFPVKCTCILTVSATTILCEIKIVGAIFL